MECPSRMTFEPSSNIGMLMGGVVVDDGVDGLSHRNLVLDSVEETDELLMAMALHVAADHPPVEDIDRGEQRRCAVTLIIVGHGPGATLFHRQSRLSAIERLNLAFFIDRQNMACAGGST